MKPWIFLRIQHFFFKLIQVALHSPDHHLAVVKESFTGDKSGAETDLHIPHAFQRPVFQYSLEHQGVIGVDPVAAHGDGTVELSRVSVGADQSQHVNLPVQCGQVFRVVLPGLIIHISFPACITFKQFHKSIV